MNGGNFRAGGGGSDLTVNGSIAINAGTFDTAGSIKAAGSITVASGSTIGGSGDIGATSVTLAAGAIAANTLGNNLSATSWTNTALIVTNALALSGNTFIVDTGTNVLAAGDYVLITNTSGGITGSFASSPVISGAGLGVGLTGTVVTTGNLVTLHVAAASSGAPVITSTVVIGGNLIISGTNSSGTAGGTYYVRATNYVAIPMASWPRISTNTYGVGGAFSVTNAVNPAVPVRFFRIEQ
jgi:roadblock/LC7 domain-containing protein